MNKEILDDLSIQSQAANRCLNSAMDALRVLLSQLENELESNATRIKNLESAVMYLQKKADIAPHDRLGAF